jgi:hypothetical protein
MQLNSVSLWQSRYRDAELQTCARLKSGLDQRRSGCLAPALASRLKVSQ